MIEDLAPWISNLFLLTTVLTIGIFHFANGKPTKLTSFIILWSIINSIFAWKGFYHKSEILPPPFLLVLIAVLLILSWGLTKNNLNWVRQNRNIELSTFIHTIRIPVEIILYYLFIDKMLPELMTFEGRNYDIIIGITAPLIGLLWLKRKLGRKSLIIWNIFGLILVLFVYINGILSSELPIQLFAFDQPSIAINYFPFVLLPATIVPIIIYTHITDIIILWTSKTALDNSNHK